MAAFLLEIGLEEIPAGMIAPAQTEMEKRCRELFVRERLASDALKIQSYSTPRRLAIVAEGLLAKQAEVEEQVVGPSLAVAYKNGAPTPAAIAFAKKNGLDVGALETIQNAKGEYVAATVRRPGRSAAEVLTSLLPAEIGRLYWPKNMYWREHKPERFVRPVRWLLALLDKEVLPLEFAGVKADALTYGHRVLHGDAPVVIDAPSKYVEKLRAAYVEVDPEARKHRIRKSLDAATRQVPGAHWREDEALVDSVTNLTEWPSPLLGSFDPGYLALPEEILVTVMRDHQKYFALEDAKGKLLPNFLAVLNTEADAAGTAIIRHGNERVLRARFNDAQFFWEQDQKIPLIDRVDMLKNVTFQKDLGSYWDKTRRIRGIAEKLQARVGMEPGASVADFYGPVWKASELAKTDLTTDMVKEFTELQGIVGGLYARAQEVSKEVSDAIYDHYKPTSASDTIPRSRTGCVVAIADKMDNIAEMFRINQKPSGSKDPFALRRAGNGVVRILVENKEIGLRLHLLGVIFATLGQFDSDLSRDVYEFLLDRFEFYLQDSHSAKLQVARAVRRSGMASMDIALANADGRTGEKFGADYGFTRVADFAKALNAQASSLNVIAVAELLKRVSNILRQAREKKISFPHAEGTESLREPSERVLAENVSVVEATIRKEYRAGNYDAVIAAIAGLQQPLNAFFDSVMVMVDDPELRANRLALLARTEATVRWAADFSELASIQQTV